MDRNSLEALRASKRGHSFYPKDNRASWADVLSFIEEFPKNETWVDWKKFMGALVREGIEEGLDQYFRAGQSMQHIIFSTCERHGLEHFDPPPPRVTVGRIESDYFVAWSHRNIWFFEAERRDIVTGENAVSTLRSYLVALWRETRPEEPFPPLKSS